MQRVMLLAMLSEWRGERMLNCSPRCETAPHLSTLRLQGVFLNAEPDSLRNRALRAVGCAWSWSIRGVSTERILRFSKSQGSVALLRIS